MNCEPADWWNDTAPTPCPSCNGWGEVYGVKCGECDGAGVIESALVTEGEAAQ